MREYSDDSLNGTIHVLPGKELIFTTIPYDAGWKVNANGESVETFEVLNGLMAFRLGAGSYNLSMEYRPACAIYGSMISGGAIVLFVLICVGDMLVRKKKRRELPATEDGGDDDELEIAELELPGIRRSGNETPPDGGETGASAGSIAAELEAEIEAAEKEKDDKAGEAKSGGEIDDVGGEAKADEEADGEDLDDEDGEGGDGK